MTVELGAALVLGLVGSGHCLLMCGPLALAIRYPGQGWRRQWSRVSYNLGRTVTYTLLGLLVGAVGQGIALAGWQRSLSILLGVSLLVLAVTRGRSDATPAWLSRPLLAAQRILYRWLGPSAPDAPPGSEEPGGEAPAHPSPFVLGLVNGLLPCGLVWAALAGAAALGSAFRGALFMATFGLATLPALFALVTVGHLVPARIRGRLARATPVVLVLLAALLVVRGLAIPGSHGAMHH